MYLSTSKLILLDRSLQADVNRVIICVNIPTSSIFITFFLFDLVYRRPCWIWGTCPGQIAADNFFLKSRGIKEVKTTEKPFLAILLILIPSFTGLLH